jgi:predicted HTH domain antitoxin
MGSVQVELDQDLIDILEELHRPVKQAARELIVLELYRQGEISSGKAAELLGLGREQFIRQASERGIPYFQLDGEELQRELDARRSSECSSSQIPTRSLRLPEFNDSTFCRLFLNRS